LLRHHIGGDPRGAAREDLYVRWLRLVLAGVEGDRERVRTTVSPFQHFPDPEGVYSGARVYGMVGETELAADWFARAEHGGYANPHLFRTDPMLAVLRDRPDYAATLARAEERHRRAVAAYGGRL